MNAAESIACFQKTDAVFRDQALPRHGATLRMTLSRRRITPHRCGAKRQCPKAERSAIRPVNRSWPLERQWGHQAVPTSAETRSPSRRDRLSSARQRRPQAPILPSPGDSSTQAKAGAGHSRLPPHAASGEPQRVARSGPMRSHLSTPPFKARQTGRDPPGRSQAQRGGISGPPSGPDGPPRPWASAAPVMHGTRPAAPGPAGSPPSRRARRPAHPNARAMRP
jgi:hypothetical protein